MSDPGVKSAGHFETQVKVSFSDRTSLSLTQGPGQGGPRRLLDAPPGGRRQARHRVLQGDLFVSPPRRVPSPAPWAPRKDVVDPCCSGHHQESFSKRRSTLDSVGGGVEEASFVAIPARGPHGGPRARDGARRGGHRGRGGCVRGDRRRREVCKIKNEHHLARVGRFQGWNAGSKSVKLGLDGMDLAIDVGKSFFFIFFGTAAIAGGFSAVGGAESLWSSSPPPCALWCGVERHLLRGGAVLPEHQTGIPL